MKNNIPEINKAYAFFDDGKRGFLLSFMNKEKILKKN